MSAGGWGRYLVAGDRDAQLVSRAEAALETQFPESPVGLDEARVWLTRIAHAEDVEPPILMQVSLAGKVLAAAILDDNVIVVRSKHMTRLTLLHELAHFVGSAGHGPHFRTTYGDLIARYLSPAHAAVFTCAVNCQGRRQ